MSAPCEKECGAFLREAIAGLGVEANFSTLPPLFDTGYTALDMRCPHGVLWYAEPTAEQRAAWIRDGVE